MKKILSGILALCITSGMTSSLFLDGAQTSTYRDTVECFCGKKDTEVCDVNEDGKINIADLVLTKQKVVNTCRQESDITSESVFKAAEEVLKKISNTRIAGRISSDQECEFTDKMKEYNFGEGTWSVDLYNNVVVSAGFTRAGSNFSGAYPHIGESYEFKDDMNNIENLNSVAKTIVKNARELSYKYKENAIKLPLLYITSEDDNGFSRELNERLETKYGYQGVRWVLNTIGYTINGAVCTVSGENTGAYPSPVPVDLPISYSNNLAFCGFSNDDFDWHQIWSNTTDLNESAAALYNNVQILALRYFKLRNKELSDGVITSQDDCAFAIIVNRLGKSITNNVISWAVTVENYKIKGVICTDVTNEKTGAFPNPVPQNLDIPFNAENTKFSEDKKYDWKTDFGKNISSDPQRAALPDYPAVSEEQATSNAVVALYLMNQRINNIVSQNADFVISDGTYDTDKLDSFPSEILTDSLSSEYTLCKKGVRCEYLIRDNKAVSVNYYDENAAGPVSMDIETMEKIIEENTIRISYLSSPYSKTIFTNANVYGNVSFDWYSETPLDRLYYTEKTTEKILNRYKELIELFISENKNAELYTETSYAVYEGTRVVEIPDVTGPAYSGGYPVSTYIATAKVVNGGNVTGYVQGTKVY